jgi:hypothetical protein
VAFFLNYRSVLEPVQGEETPKEIEQVLGLVATLDSGDGSNLLVVCFETGIETDLARSQQERLMNQEQGDDQGYFKQDPNSKLICRKDQGP